MDARKPGVFAVVALLAVGVAWLLLGSSDPEPTEGQLSSQRAKAPVVPVAPKRVALRPQVDAQPPVPEVETDADDADDADDAVAAAPSPEEPDEGEEDLPIPEGVSVWPVSKDGIDGAVGEVITDIRQCYQTALSEVPDLAGDLLVQFTIGSTDGIGKVIEVGIPDGDLVDGPMEDCVLDVMSVLQFDPPAEDTVVTYPFRFST